MELLHCLACHCAHSNWAIRAWAAAGTHPTMVWAVKWWLNRATIVRWGRSDNALWSCLQHNGIILLDGVVHVITWCWPNSMHKKKVEKCQNTLAVPLCVGLSLCLGADADGTNSRHSNIYTRKIFVYILSIAHHLPGPKREYLITQNSDANRSVKKEYEEILLYQPVSRCFLFTFQFFCA